MKYEETCCENKIRKLTGAKPSHTKAQAVHRAPMTDQVTLSPEGWTSEYLNNICLYIQVLLNSTTRLLADLDQNLVPKKRNCLQRSFKKTFCDRAQSD
jgi:hypothetical protein